MTDSPDELFRPLVACDAVLFKGEGAQTEVLLITRKHPPFQGMWAFPGGLLDEGESCEACVARELEEETSLTGVELTQLGAWSDPGRDPRGQNVSIVYTGVVTEAQAAQVKAGDDAAEADWVRLDELSAEKLAFDHGAILAAARRKLGR